MHGANAKRSVEHRTFASLRAGYDPALEGCARRVVTREQYDRRRQERAAEDATPRGRFEYPLTAARRDGFTFDGSMLVTWAHGHDVCCRKVARRILALCLSGRADEAVKVAKVFARGLHTHRDKPKSSCQLSLEPVIAEYEHRETIDWDFFWRRSRPDKPYRIDAARFVWERQDWDSNEVVALLDLIEGLPNSRIHWPESVTGYSHLTEWVEDVQTLAEAPPRLDLHDEFWNWAATPAKVEKVEPVTSSLEDDIKWFSGDRGNVSRLREGSSFRRDLVSREVEAWSRSYAPSDSNETVWESVKYMAYKMANDFCDKQKLHGHLTDLVQVACITVIEARRTYDGRAKFSTYAHTAIYYAMVDYHRDLVARKSKCDYTDDVLLGDDLVCGADEFIPERLDLKRLFREIPDLRFVLTKVCGIPDDDLDETNVRVRRHRAIKRAQTALTPAYATA